MSSLVKSLTSHDGLDVGYFEGRFVSPGIVGNDVDGFIEGEPEGLLVGLLDVGRTVGCPVGVVDG